MPPRKTLAATSSQPNNEALDARVVLAHPRVVFHPYTSGLHESVATIAAALIRYNDVEVAVGTTTRKRRS
jgi:hypothetical protein